jgi:flavin-dependent dehydrogenase
VTADVLVVGGGVAGGAAAIALTRAGRRVVLLERETGPHDKVCGEFLSGEAVQYLRALGVDPLALGARRIDGLRLAAGTRVASVPLPFPALSLSRRTLDAALLERAATVGADVRHGAPVQALAREEGGWSARLRDGATVATRQVFLATGKHDLRGWPRPKGTQSDLLGFKQYWRLDPGEMGQLSNHVELMLFEGGYAGLEAVEDGRANLCLLVRRDRFAALGQRWDALLKAIRTECRLLDRRLTGGEAGGDRPLAIYAIPYGFVARPDDGLWRIGDQAAVIPSFSGDGMSIALHSAALAARCFIAGRTAAEYQRRMAADIGWPVRLATAISRFAVGAAGRLLIGHGASRMPALMAAVAAATRVPGAALRRAGLTPTDCRP